MCITGNVGFHYSYGKVFDTGYADNGAISLGMGDPILVLVTTVMGKMITDQVLLLSKFTHQMSGSWTLNADSSNVFLKGNRK